MSNKKRKKMKNPDMLKVRRQRVGIIVSVILMAALIVGFVGYRAWIAYNNTPEKIAQKFVDAFSVYNSSEMAAYATPSWWKKDGDYYKNISHALGVLADKIAKEKGLPRAMLKPQLNIELPPITQWNVQDNATRKIFSYDGKAILTFPESQTLSTARVPIHVHFSISLCKDSGKWRVCSFERSRVYEDWTAYEFIEARMAADTEHLEQMLCSTASEGVKSYINGYDIMVHDPVGDSNIAWVISHIGKIDVRGNDVFIDYGLYKVSSQDPTNPVMKWKYLDVMEHLEMCKENGLWYIKNIQFQIYKKEK